MDRFILVQKVFNLTNQSADRQLTNSQSQHNIVPIHPSPFFGYSLCTDKLNGLKVVTAAGENRALLQWSKLNNKDRRF